MDLKIKEVAELLNVSETTIRRWLADGKIPSYRINNQHRFNRNEIEDWVMSQQPSKEPENTKSDKGKQGSKQFSLFRAIHKGGLFPNIPGDSKEEVIRTTMKRLARHLNLDAEVLTDLLLDREILMPTALNNGIGIPHTRDFLLNAHHDVVTVVFPEEPIPYGALDGKPVHTLFFLFACDDKRHLHLLAKIAHLCNQPQSIKFLQSKPSQEKMLDYIKSWESSLS